MKRLAVLTSHPIQYYGPLFRELAKGIDLHVFFSHRATPEQQARAGFGAAFDWDVDITCGYGHSFLQNVARRPGTDHFSGCDTPGIGQHLREGEFDVLLVTGWHLKSYLQGLFAAKRLGIPVMVRGDSHLGTPRSLLKSVGKSLVYPRFLRFFDAALYVGARSRGYYEHYRYPVERLFFSPHCVDTELFAARATQEARASVRERHGISEDTTVLLFAGKLVEFKRPDDLLTAAALCRARGRNVEVMIAGDGNLRDRLTASATALDLPLHLLGFCNQTEMPAAYAASDCLVLPSDGHETWGLVANEGLACGRPIIVSSACGCCPDLTSNTDVGRAFPVGDVHALASAIEALTETPCSANMIAAFSRKYGLEAGVEGITKALTHLPLGS